MPATLFVVATPIGNLEDFTFRALRTLREVDVIAAEDTRRTAKLLAHYEIRRPVVSLHEHNEHREAPRLVARLANGESVALVSDAGTPGICDPGAVFVRAVREAGFPVIAIPGPSAVTAALSVSGLPADSFVFMGFPPASGRGRTEWFDRLAQEDRTVVFFEAPHRIERTLADAEAILAERQIIVNREVSKLNDISGIYHNESGSDDGLTKELGEFTIVVGPASEAVGDLVRLAADGADKFGCLTERCGFDRDLAFRLLAVAYGVRPDQVKNVVKKAKIAAKRRADGTS